MAKNVISFPQGKLMEVAKEKGVNSKNALHDRTGVDRKTIQAANEGRPIKKSTAQKILDRIRVPLEHMTGGGFDPNGPSTHNLELTAVDGKSLKHLLDAVSTPDKNNETIKWKVNLDKVDDALHSSLLYFKKQVLAYVQLHGQQSLEGQLSKICVSEELESIVQNFRGKDAKVFAGSWVRWQCSHDDSNLARDHAYEQSFRSYDCVILAIEPKTKTSSRAEVDYGRIPPRRFDPPGYVDLITIDDVTVWCRDNDLAVFLGLDVDDPPV
jgi:hypothetical protein